MLYCKKVATKLKGFKMNTYNLYIGANNNTGKVEQEKLEYYLDGFTDASRCVCYAIATKGTMRSLHS